MKKHWAVVLPLLAAACSGPQDANHDGIADGVLKPDSVSVVAPATPKGTVSGQLVDTKLQPLPDVTVAMTIGSATTDAPVMAKSDAAGNFMFTNVPAGSQVLLTLSKDGYATLRAYAVVPSSAGNIPIDDGNASIGMVSLAEARSTVRFTLITPSGRPAANAQAYIQAVPSGVALAGSTNAVSSVTGTAQADAQGVVTFGNMPSLSDLQRLSNLGAYSALGVGYQLWVDPVDLNGDGIIDSAGTSTFISASDVGSYGPSRFIELKQPINEVGSSTFALKVSNVASLTGASKDPLRNLIRTNEPIYLAFTQPVVKNSLLVTVTDEAGAKGSTIATPTANTTSDTFSAALPSSLAAPGAPTVTSSITEGQHYNVLVRATSAYDGSTVSYRGYFVAGDTKSPISTVSATVTFRDVPSGTANRLENGECVIVTFNQVVLPPDSGSNLVEAFFNTALGNTGAKGEYNTTASAASTTAVSGFQLTQAPAPLNTTNCLNDTVPSPYNINPATFVYTPRYVFYMQTGSGITVNPGVGVRLAFSKQAQLNGGLTGGTYETAWASPITQDIDTTLSSP